MALFDRVDAGDEAALDLVDRHVAGDLLAVYAKAFLVDDVVLEPGVARHRHGQPGQLGPKLEEVRADRLMPFQLQFAGVLVDFGVSA